MKHKCIAKILFISFQNGGGGGGGGSGGFLVGKLLFGLALDKQTYRIHQELCNKISTIFLCECILIQKAPTI